MLKADKAFSLLVRTIFSDHNGICYCVTCGAAVPIKQIDCGHYKSRKHLATRYDLDNCRPQCVTCNRFNDGDEVRFRNALVNEIGEIRVSAVEFNSRVVSRLSENDFLEIAEESAAKLKAVLIEKNATQNIY